MSGAGARREGTTCIGIDVGGTFTDAVLTTGSVTYRAKAPTTPDDLGRGVLDACRLVAERAGTRLEDLLGTVGRFGLGTTAVTNVLATGGGLAVGLVTTKGFEDNVPLAKGRRANDAEGWIVPPPTAVDWDRVIGVAERIDRDGNVLVPLRDDEVVAAGRTLVAERGAQALAVSFIWGFRHPAHEERATALLRDALPGIPVVSAAALNPVLREYERTTFALLNARVSGALGGVDQLADTLRGMGLRVPLLLVHSAGGTISVDEARRVPLGLASSGPAAGVAASVTLAHEMGLDDVVTCDMGGTSYDVAVIVGGVAARRTRGDLVGIFTTLPQIDIESIGAGGGSIGWVDTRGMLRVGPRSAGAVPGPACYGRGGAEPTVTDALVVLGHLDPQRFLGGEMQLDAAAAARACAALGEQIGLDAHETAWGIRRLALADMARAVRARLSTRGLDPRRQTLLSYGGCGALFTPEIAATIGAPAVLVPELASVLSGFGAATADVRRERARTLGLVHPVADDVIETLVTKIAAELAEQIDADLAADGIPAADRTVSYEVDLRFARQANELAIPVRDGAIDRAALDALVEDFRADYARRYGRGSMTLGAGIELVTLRAIGLGRTLKASSPLHELGERTMSAGVALRTRRVRLERGADGWVDVPIHDAAALTVGATLRGPTLVDGRDTTVWVPPGVTATLDRHGTLVMTVGATDRVADRVDSPSPDPDDRSTEQEPA
jgi:N-methylhydantoinase A